MDREELLALDKETLVDLILRLYERVTEVEAGVGRPPKGPANSSVPRLDVEETKSRRPKKRAEIVMDLGAGDAGWARG